MLEKLRKFREDLQSTEYSAKQSLVPFSVLLGERSEKTSARRGSITSSAAVHLLGGGGDIPYNGLYEEASPRRGTFFRLQVYRRVGISQVEVFKRVGKSVI